MTTFDNQNAAGTHAVASGSLQRHSRGLLSCVRVGVLLCALGWSAAQAQQPSAQTTITPAFRDADLAQVIEAVATITGKTIIPDPRVRANVTILSSTPMTPQQFYQTFLSVLQVHGFVAVESGNTVKIIPDANARQFPSHDLPTSVSPTSDELVTQVIEVKNVNAAQLVPSLRPFVPQYGQLVAIVGTNMLVITDRAANVARMIRIIRRIDQTSDEDIDIVRLENASAADIVRVVNTLFTGPGAQAEAPGRGAKLVADERTNSVLISGDQGQRLRLKALVTHLDTPLEAGGDTQVWYLRYADAEALAGKLKEQITGITQPAPGQQQAPAGPTAAAERNTLVWADPQTNSLVVTAPPKIMRQIKAVVDKLDVRRAQVLIEAILVEIQTNKAAELGVNWAIDGTGDDNNFVPVGLFNTPIAGTSIGSIAAIIQNPATAITSGLPSAFTLGAGRFKDSGVNFAVLLRALRTDSTSNILQTPSILTLDNEEAEIKVAQEVPFLTGSFTNTGAAQGQVTPFQTIQREEVGQILKITPQINEGDSVQLKIEQESSNVAPSVPGAVDIVTNKRTISTTVLVEDGGVVVLGGLISDTVLEDESRVPILGSIPLIGELFKTRSGSKDKQNLMVFIRPTILRDSVDAAVETNAKYNLMRNRQLTRKQGRVTLLPGESQPLLPPIEDLSKYADPTAGSQKPSPETDPTATPATQPAPIEEKPLPSREPPPPVSPPLSPPAHPPAQPPAQPQEQEPRPQQPPP
jgi:general secretion pathway protein D